MTYDWQDVEDPAGIIKNGMIAHFGEHDTIPFYCVAVCAPPMGLGIDDLRAHGERSRDGLRMADLKVRGGIDRDKMLVYIRWASLPSQLKEQGPDWHHAAVSIGNAVPFTWQETLVNYWIKTDLDQFKQWIDEEDEERKRRNTLHARIKDALVEYVDAAMIAQWECVVIIVSHELDERIKHVELSKAMEKAVNELVADQKIVKLTCHSLDKKDYRIFLMSMKTSLQIQGSPWRRTP